ncbi:MAG: exo-alpha-sialidase [Verrucomicrobiae bacterium]|nr:exo-alpha-sialidase [Verrucomicrobiae bacterium]
MKTPTLRVSTRKGLFTLKKQGRDWTITSVDFPGEPVTMFLQDPRDGSCYAALNLGHFGVKLWRKLPREKEWKEIACPAFPKVENPDASDPAPSLGQIWCLETGGTDQPGFLWCGTIPGGLFSSRDRGDSWQLNESLWNAPERKQWMGGGYDKPGIHSICVDPRKSHHVSLAVSSGGVWTTDDGGESWKNIGHGLRAEYMPPEKQFDLINQDPHRMVACPANPDFLWIQHHNGIFSSTDGGLNWREHKGVKPSVFGFAVAVHPADPQTAWFVPAIKDERRIPVAGKLSVTRTRNAGKSFQSLRKGLPQKHAYDLVYRHCLEVDGTGRRLGFGSTTGHVWISENSGDSWKLVSAHLPPVYAIRWA